MRSPVWHEAHAVDINSRVWSSSDTWQSAHVTPEVAWVPSRKSSYLFLPNSPVWQLAQSSADLSTSMAKPAPWHDSQETFSEAYSPEEASYPVVWHARQASGFPSESHSSWNSVFVNAVECSDSAQSSCFEVWQVAHVSGPTYSSDTCASAISTLFPYSMMVKKNKLQTRIRCLFPVFINSLPQLVALP